eukprot:572029-Pelagomonas_calceolata.AAC.1
MYDVSLLGEAKRAVRGLASLLWVPGRAGMHGRPLLSFWSITLLQLNFHRAEYADGWRIKKGAD